MVACVSTYVPSTAQSCAASRVKLRWTARWWTRSPDHPPGAAYERNDETPLPPWRFLAGSPCPNLAALSALQSVCRAAGSSLKQGSPEGWSTATIAVLQPASCRNRWKATCWQSRRW